MTRDEVDELFKVFESWETTQYLDDDFDSLLEGPSGPILLTRETRQDPLTPESWIHYEDK